mmetsp:Transcript_100162/g.229926  ORF Transcript_100162/g.229926 Transcript_100162/m.229926 type:complete len:344 (-) Transcript_100162:305-1336(-)
MLCSWSLATQDVVLGVAVSVVLASTGFFCFYWFRLPSECTRSISPGRSVLVDNLKGVLILTIVWGHVTAIPTLIVPQEAFVWGPALAWSSMFHMPAFSFLSGLCSKSVGSSASYANLVCMVLGPYVASKLLWWLDFCWRQGLCVPLNLFDTYQVAGLEWYLACLFTWRLLTPLLLAMRSHVMLLAALVLGLLAGHWIGNTQVWALQRCFAFLPFFAAGLCVSRDDLEKWHSLRDRGVCLMFLIASFAAMMATRASVFDLGKIGDLNFDYSAERLENAGWQWAARLPCGVEYWMSSFHRLLRYCVSAPLIGCLIAATPSYNCWLTKIGSRSMFVYLVHPSGVWC